MRRFPQYSLAIWHGFNAPLVMSLIALAGGVALYFGLQRFINLHRIVQVPRGGREAFAFVLARTVQAARDLTLGLQNGSLQRYLLLLVAMAVTAGLLPFLLGAMLRARTPASVDAARPRHSRVLWFVGIVAALATLVEFRHRLLALTVLGAVGLVVALMFVVPVGPDLALTQLLVEVATVILMMLALNWLPQESPVERSAGAARPARGRRLRGRSGRHGPGLARADAALRLDLAVLPRDRGAARRRSERGQRDHRRLPRLRHPRRDHGARHCRAGDRGPAARPPPARRCARSPTRCRPSATRIR